MDDDEECPTNARGEMGTAGIERCIRLGRSIVVDELSASY